MGRDAYIVIGVLVLAYVAVAALYYFNRRAGNAVDTGIPTFGLNWPAELMRHAREVSALPGIDNTPTLAVAADGSAMRAFLPSARLRTNAELPPAAVVNPNIFAGVSL